MTRVTILQGDVRATLAALPDDMFTTVEVVAAPAPVVSRIYDAANPDLGSLPYESAHVEDTGGSA